MISSIERASSLTLTVVIFLSVASAQAPNRDPSATAFASIAETEVSQFRDGITLTTWMDTRGKRERWETNKAEVDRLNPRPECLSLVKVEALPSGAEAKRALYFYPPEPRSPYLFPTGSVNQLLGACVLGMLRIEAEAPTPEIGYALDRAVRQRLTRLYGESVGHKDVPFWGRSYRREGARWIHTAQIVAGWDAKMGDGSPNQFLLGSVAFVDARLPFEKSRFEMSGAENPPYGALQPESQFHRAIILTGLNADLSDRFTKFYGQAVQALAKPPATEDKQREELLLSLLQEWINAIGPLPSARRAAGLLAADRLLAVSDWRLAKPREKSEQRSQLQLLGAVFQANNFANDYFYTRSWEKQARELDPNGPVGQMATLGFMARGSCEENGGDSNLFREIILEGEDLLATRLDAATAAQVHFMVGDGYADIVAIAGGLEGDGDFSVRPGEGVIEGGKALFHYRAGLAVDKTSDSAKTAWMQAWRLSAGLLPALQRYVCGSD